MDIDQIERLAKLHRDGLLTDEEFAAGKAKALGGEGSGFAPAAPRPGQVSSSSGLSASWQKRFAFFDLHGSPFSKEATLASRELKFGERSTIFFNIWAMLFGIVYFVVIGIPKRGITLLAIALGLAMVLWGFETFFDYSPTWYWFGLWAIYGGTANYYYYIKVRQGRDEWNPLKDLF